MKYKFVFNLIVLCCVITTFVSCAKSVDTTDNNLNANNDMELLEISLSTQYQPEYYICIDENYNYSLYINKELVECISLDKLQIETVNDFIDTFNSKTDKNDDFVFDYWTVKVKTGFKEELFTYGYSGVKLVDDEINAILSFSPTKLVDTNGNDIKEFDEP